MRGREVMRRVSRIRVRPRRKGNPSATPARQDLATVLTADQIQLNAQLHDYAAQTVSTALERMQQRSQQATRSNPELAPFLTAYFEAAGASLMQNTLALLDDQSVLQPMPQPRHTPAPSRRQAFLRFIPGRGRKEEHDGQA